MTIVDYLNSIAPSGVSFEPGTDPIPDIVVVWMRVDGEIAEGLAGEPKFVVTAYRGRIRDLTLTREIEALHVNSRFIQRHF